MLREVVSIAIGMLFFSGCGRAPSSLLRQGQIPVNDFPMFLTDGAAGIVYKLNEDRSKEVLVKDLNDPRGIATDAFNNLYVAEYGAGRVLKVDPKSGSYDVMRDQLSSPSIVAADSFNEVFVTQDGARNIIRASDGEVVKEFSDLPSALVFGVNDEMIVGLFDANKVYWGDEDNATDVNSPVNLAIDGTGRVYVSEGISDGGRVLRYHQQDAGGDPKEVAKNLQSPMGSAVDSVGNIYVVEQAGGRIILIDYQGHYYEWQDQFLDPQYLTFTKY